MAIDYSGSILLSVRRIIRSIDRFNKELGRSYELTMPQLMCLRQLLKDGELTPGQLAKAVYLSQATLTGIIDRLEQKELITRNRSKKDRRKMLIRLTAQGTQTANDIPWPLQERFAKRLQALEEAEKKQIDNTLKRLVEMMEAPSSPMWALGPKKSSVPELANHTEQLEKINGR